MKRNDYINWQEYFMGIAILSGKRSKDPSTQVGACIVTNPDINGNNGNTIVSVGYNGFPSGCSDDLFPWGKNGTYLETKYPFVVHAELNAILNVKGKDLTGTSIYVGLFPCNECAKAIIQSGIKEVVYLSDKYAETDSVKASKMMFNSAGIKLTKLKPSKEKIIINLNPESI